MAFGSQEIIIIALLVLLLFGSAKIPAMARNIAQGVKTFKKEMKDESSEKEKPKKKVAKKKAK